MSICVFSEIPRGFFSILSSHKHPEKRFPYYTEDSEHTEEFREIFSRIDEDAPESFEYTESDEYAGCSFFESGYIIDKSSGIEDDEMILDKEILVFICPYLLERRAGAIQE